MIEYIGYDAYSQEERAGSRISVRSLDCDGEFIRIHEDGYFCSIGETFRFDGYVVSFFFEDGTSRLFSVPTLSEAFKLVENEQRARAHSRHAQAEAAKVG